MGKKFKSGYTLTELAVAIAFISVLLLTIATVTLNLANMYHKGTTLKSVNTIGLELIDEFKSAVAAAPIFDYHAKCQRFSDASAGEEESPRKQCENDKGRLFIFQAVKNGDFGTKVESGEAAVESKKQIEQGGTSLADNTQHYGFFCTGKYTYIWNTGYVLGQTDEFTRSSKIYDGGSSFNDETFRLKKYQDEGGKICERNLVEKSYVIKVSLLSLDGKEVLNDELITTKDIAIYDFTVDQPIQIEGSAKGTTLAMHLSLGSITGGIDVNDKYAGCNINSIDNVSSYDINYCAAYKFNFSQTIQN